MKPFLLCTAVFIVFISPTYSQTPKYFVGSGEYQNFIIDNTTHTLYSLGTGAGKGIGTNTENVGYATPAQFTSGTPQIKYVASGLHTAVAVDMNGNVWFAGPNEDGSMGNGTTTGSASSFQQITTDSLGNPFTNVNYVSMGSAVFTGGQGYGACVFAIKNDGTLWVWGNTQGGYRGDGTYGQVNTLPVQVPLPAGTVITKVLIQNTVIALDANGNVWTWAGNNMNSALLGNLSRTDYMTPEKVSLPGPAKDIAGGTMWSYALLQSGNLYGWGLYEGYMGVGTSGLMWTNMAGPMLLDGQLNLPAPISQISCNKTGTYVILTNGQLWAWGGNECGQIGIGQELNYALYTTNPAPYGGTPTPYAWDWNIAACELQQHKPIQVAPGINNFVGLSQGEETVFYEFAVDANGQLYSWGRNKAGVLGNGVEDGNWQNGMISATYPNSFDVPYITAVNPIVPTGTKTILSTSPECITNPSASECSIYAVPANTPPVANPGPNQTITSGTTATLDGTGSTDNVAIVYYLWTEVSGPNNALIVLPSSPKVQVQGLVNGVYTFQLRCIDNGWMRDSATVTVTVNSTGSQPPVASAGTNQTITLPTNSVTLVGSGTEVGGTIASFAWTQVSGPSTASFGSSGLATTTANNLVQGTYVFQLTVTDLLGITATSTVTVIVNAAPAGPPSANAGSNQTITLPANSVSLGGSGSETNGTIVSYAWTQVSGPSTATIASPASAFTGVTGLVQGTYTFQLTVTDNSGKTASATMTVTVNAAPVVGPPSANAGSNQTITLPANSVTLTGSGSETNGSIVSYSWTQVSGPSTATLSSAAQSSTVASGLVQGTYTFQLTVTDNSGNTAIATMTVTVNPAPVVPGTPQVSAGPDQVIALPSTSVRLFGNASETNGTIVSYAWTQVSGPSTATFTAATQASTVVEGLAQGVYTFQLTVTDNSGTTANATVTVTVNAAPVVAGPPSADAGTNQILTLPTNSLWLYGSGSETNGSIVSYSWTQVSGPSTVTLYSASQASTIAGGFVQGTYTFQLTVTDNSGQTASATVTVTVNAAALDPAPVAEPGANQTVTESSSPVVLNGSASYAPDGTIVGYDWIQVAGAGGVTIANSTTATPSIYGLQPGSYTFQLTVTNNQGTTGSADVTITVVSASGPSLVANAGVTDTVHLPMDTATLNGSGSTVTTGSIVSYSWKEVGGPSTVTLGDAASSVTQISGLEAGGYTFQLTVTDNNGDTASAEVNVIVVNSDLRTSDISSLRLWPNPVQSMLNVAYQSTDHDEFTLSIVNTSGVILATTAYDNVSGQMNIQLNVGQLARGVYFLVLKDSSGQKMVRKFVKQ